GAPGLAEQMHAAQAERPAHRLDLLDIALDAPQRRVLRPVRGPGAELVVDDDAVAGIGHPAVAVADIVAGQARTAVQAEQHLLAGAEAVDRHLMSRDGYPLDGIRLPRIA